MEGWMGSVSPRRHSITSLPAPPEEGRCVNDLLTHERLSAKAHGQRWNQPNGSQKSDRYSLFESSLVASRWRENQVRVCLR
jgi:hypothetical protein